jgi:phage antirepressor YoqD-like protein
MNDSNQFSNTSTLRNETLQRGVTNGDTPISKMFAYDGNNVTFAKKGNLVMVNATQMAKPFGDSKRAKNWLALKSTDEFLAVLSEGRNLPSSDLVRVTYGNNGTTWMHEDVAIEFARWLSPAFAIWCNDRIKELLTIGITATPQTIDTILADPDNAIRLLTALKEERQQRQLAESKAALLEEVTKEQAPKVAFADAITGSDTNITVRNLAKLLCQNGYQTGEKRLYEWLRANHYVTCDNKPMQRYVEQGIFFIAEGTHSENGVMKAHMTTKITPKGQQYFINKFIHN